MAIETWRYYRTPLELRHCKICKKDIIEDPLHFMCVCDCYSLERQELAINTIGIRKYLSLSVIDQFVHMMSVTPKLLTEYVDKIWIKRKQITEM